jgi:predicted negative regulator of RcsB-dependent stress response
VLYDHLGDAYLKVGQTTEAIEAWERSLKVDPSGPTAEAIKKKLQDAHEIQLRTKGAPKAQQQK